MAQLKLKMQYKAIFPPISPVVEWNGLRVYFAKIDADAAERALEKRNAQNRRPRANNLKRIKRAMDMGRWMLTHQGVAFDRKGLLIDGQHRLTAISQTGTPQQMLVCEGFDPIARAKIDDGTMRTLADKFAITKAVKASDAQKIGQIINAIRRYAFSVDVKCELEDGIDEIEKYRAGLEWACDFGDPNHIPAIRSSAVMGAFVFAFPLISSIATEALNDLISGENLTKNDPLLLLRTQILAEGKHFRSEPVRQDYFFKTLNALYHRLTGKTCRTLRRSDESFAHFRAAYGN